MRIRSQKAKSELKFRNTWQADSVAEPLPFYQEKEIRYDIPRTSVNDLKGEKPTRCLFGDLDYWASA